MIGRSQVQIPLGHDVFYISPGAKHIEVTILLGIDGNSQYFNFGSLSLSLSLSLSPLIGHHTRSLDITHAHWTSHTLTGHHTRSLDITQYSNFKRQYRNLFQNILNMID